MAYFHYGLKNKIMSSHALNDASSRSHCILTVTVESIEIDNPDNIVISNLQLVDLAGSERSAQTNVGTGVQNEFKNQQLKKESIDINKSLFTLRQVVSMLNKPDGEKGKYIPYRESKLTSLLRHSLGGNSYCLMIACVSPSSIFYNENVSTLNYASKASSISNKPIKNHDPKNKIIQELKREVKSLREQVMMAHGLYNNNNGNNGAEMPPIHDLKSSQSDESGMKSAKIHDIKTAEGTSTKIQTTKNFLEHRNSETNPVTTKNDPDLTDFK